LPLADSQRALEAVLKARAWRTKAIDSRAQRKPLGRQLRLAQQVQPHQQLRTRSRTCSKADRHRDRCQRSQPLQAVPNQAQPKSLEALRLLVELAQALAP
jgi:hypothetical protein